VTRLPIGAITPQTQENTMFLRGQGLKHCGTRVLEDPAWKSAAGGAHLVGLTENNDLALKSGFLHGFWSLSGKVGGCRPLKN